MDNEKSNPKNTYTYDSKGKIASLINEKNNGTKTIYTYENGVKKDAERHKYDKNNNLTTTITYFYDSNGKAFIKSRVTHDKNGIKRSAEEFNINRKCLSKLEWDKNGEFCLKEELLEIKAGKACTVCFLSVKNSNSKNVTVKYSINYKTRETRFFADNLIISTKYNNKEIPFKNLIIEGDNNNIIGSKSDDILKVKGNNNVIDLAEGNDNLTIEGENNIINTGAGDDIVDSTGNNNTINTGEGDDSVVAKGNNITVDTGSGTDSVITKGADNTIVNDDLTIRSKSDDSSVAGIKNGLYGREVFIYDSNNSEKEIFKDNIEEDTD